MMALWRVKMADQCDSERFQQIVNTLDALPPGVDDTLRDDLLRELNGLEYKAGLGLLASSDVDA